MTEEILPVDREVLAAIEEEVKEETEVKHIDGGDIIETEEKEEKEEKEGGREEEKELFDKKKEIEVKPKKKKRQLSEAQLENLKKARAKSAEKRKALKEARDMDKAEKKLIRDKAKDQRAAKRQEEDEFIEMKAKLRMDAEKAAVWDEDRLTSLIEKTLDRYAEKKKKAKPIPKAHIPAQLAYPNRPANDPIQTDPRYYTIPQQHTTQSAATYVRQPRQQPNNDPMNNLFGFNPNNNY